MSPGTVVLLALALAAALTFLGVWAWAVWRDSKR